MKLFHICFVCIDDKSVSKMAEHLIKNYGFTIKSYLFDGTLVLTSEYGFLIDVSLKDAFCRSRYDGYHIIFLQDDIFDELHGDAVEKTKYTDDIISWIEPSTFRI